MQMRAQRLWRDNALRNEGSVFAKRHIQMLARSTGTADFATEIDRGHLTLNITFVATGGWNQNSQIRLFDRDKNRRRVR
jgi:hypothetical protein